MKKKMKFYGLAIVCLSTMISCDDTTSENILDGNDGTQAKYTYGMDSWDQTDSTTRVLLNANNSSNLDQDITFTVEVLNDSGETFMMDTTIQFSSDEKEKNLELTLETFGTIDTVMVSAIDL